MKHNYVIYKQVVNIGGTSIMDPEMVLVVAGIDPERMEYLSRDERVRILMSAGLDPSEFDF